tara:strand:+ start:13293 stop:14807 length:1515 start_codon:yes stop_codon:yes gene_type:complete
MDFDAISSAINLLTSSGSAWLVLVPGILIGLIFSAIPGLTISIAMAVFLPSTFYMDFLSSLIFLTAIYTGGAFGSAIPAILFNMPGQPAATATAFDGFPMTQQGRHNEALGLGLMASVVGTLFGYLVLAFTIEPIGRFVLKLGPTEMLIVAIWGLTLIAGLHGGSFARGFLAGTFGLLLGTIGLSSRGDVRGTMDIVWLLDGIPTVPALMGAFAISELFNLMHRLHIVENQEQRKLDLPKIVDGMLRGLRKPWSLVRGSAIGVLIGAIPGVGGSVANLVSYAQARRQSDNPDSFGSGNPEGVIAAESANSGSEAGSMATLLALGLPGGGGTAVMLGAFAMHNITGGPRFLHDQKDIVYAVIFSNFIQGIALLVLGLGFVWIASAIVKVPIRLLVPIVIVLAIFGSYSLEGNISGPVTLLIFSALGWVMRRYGYSVAALIIGLLLGRMTEGSLLRTYQLGGGELDFLLTRPIALVLMALLIVSLFLPVIMRRLRRSRPGFLPGSE